MIYYFTSNNLIGSKLIRWGLDDDCSHMAVGFFSHEWSPLVESTMTQGFDYRVKKRFLEQNTLVHALRYVEDANFERTMLSQICSHLDGTSYDYKGVAFWSAVALGYKMGLVRKDEMDGFNNRWADRQSVYCAEILKAQREWLAKIGFDVSILDRQNLRPHKAYVMLKETGKFEDLPIDGQVF